MNYERTNISMCAKVQKYAQIRTADRIEGHFFYYTTSKSKRKNVTQSKLTQIKKQS